MVGVAGRSKGCITCRERKVKCDETHPTCDRCKKTFLPCGGYERRIVFLNDGPHLKRTHGRVPKSSPPSPANGTADNSSASSKDKFVDTVARLSEPIGSIAESISLVGFQDSIFISHLVAKLFPKFVDARGKLLDNVSWIMTDIQGEEGNSASCLSTRALATSYFGRVNRLPDIMKKGACRYGQALQQLGLDIQDSQQASSYSTLKSAMCLGVYELVVYTKQDAWMRHIDGIGALVEMRGPYKHQSELEQTSFKANRMLITLKSLLRRQHCFLEQTDWKTVPWALDPSLKTITDYYGDILCDIPGFLADLETIRGASVSEDDLPSMRIELYQKITTALQDLYVLRWRWESEFPNSAYEVVTDPSIMLSVDDEARALFPTVIHFNELDRAIEMNLYNAMLLLLLNAQKGLQLMMDSDVDIPWEADHLLSDHCSPPSPLLLPGEGNCREIAREICRVVDFLLLSYHHNVGAFMLMFPLRVAYHNFNPDDAEAKWLQKIMLRIADFNGFEIAQSLPLAYRREL